MADLLGRRTLGDGPIPQPSDAYGPPDAPESHDVRECRCGVLWVPGSWYVAHDFAPCPRGARPPRTWRR